MNELIKIATNENQEQIVSARDLHEFLESCERFSKWFNRMLDYGFILNVDYTPYQIVHPQNKQEIIDYHIKIDMAKELSMLARNEKGKQARRYFISCEKKLKNNIKLPMNYKEALEHLIVQVDKNEKLALELKEQKSKVEFYDDAMNSETLINMNDLAKTLTIRNDNGNIIGRNVIYRALRELNILNNDNKPYQRYVRQRLFKLVEKSYNNPKTGENVLYFKTFLTQKGMSYVHSKLKPINLFKYKD